VLGTGKELYRLLARLVKKVCVAQGIDLRLVTGVAGSKPEGFHELARDKKRGAV